MEVSQAVRGAGLKETFKAGLVLLIFLLLAVSSRYLAGDGLYREVIWDPVGVYLYLPGDKLAAESFRSGYFPLWDHTRGLGGPNTSPVMANVEFPLKILGYVMDSASGWELYILLRLFLAGLFCFLFARDVPLGFAGSVLAATAFMLTGFFREYHNLPDLNVMVVFPLLLLLVNRFARRPTLGSFVGLCLLYQFQDSHPETYVLASAYYLVHASIMCAAGARAGGPREFWRRLFLLLLVHPVGLIVEADTVVPFIEQYLSSWHFHASGLGSLVSPPRTMIALATPLFDYWISAPPNLELENLQQLSLVTGYLGAVVVVLALAGFYQARKMSPAMAGMAVLAIFSAGVIFGIPPFCLFNRLPLVRAFQNFRYAQPFMALAAAMLAGRGLELAMDFKKAGLLALAISGLVLSWIAAHFYIFRHQILSSELVQNGALIAAGAALVLAGLALALSGRFGRRRTLAVALIVGCGLELALYFNMAQPLFGPEAFGTVPPPAAIFIKERQDGPSRVWGLDQTIIHPNLAGLYGLSDLRDQNALYVKEYVRLLARVNGWQNDLDITRGFMSDGMFYFDFDMGRIPPGLLDAMNARFVLSHREPGATPLAESLRTVRLLAPSPLYVGQGQVSVGGVARRSLILHAPARISLPLDGKEGIVAAEAAIMEKAADCEGADGVSFVAMIDNGSRRLAYARHFRPQKESRWHLLETRVKAGDKEALFAALAGPRDSIKCDFGVVGMPVRKNDGSLIRLSHGFEKIYDREMMVFENTDYLARVFVPERLEEARDFEDALSGIMNEGPARVTMVAGIDGPLRATDAEVGGIDEGFGWLSFESNARGRSFAVISNLFYPGWRAYINGEETRIYRVNAVMQGLFLPEGRSQVRLEYVPASYRVGLWIQIVMNTVFAGALAARLIGKRGGKKSSGSVPA